MAKVNLSDFHMDLKFKVYDGDDHNLPAEDPGAGIGDVAYNLLIFKHDSSVFEKAYREDNMWIFPFGKERISIGDAWTVRPHSRDKQYYLKIKE